MLHGETLTRAITAAEQPLLYRFEAKLTVVPVGLVPDGFRMANSFEGRVVEGIMKGARVSGTDHLLLRPDGVALIDAQKLISLGETHLYEHVRGYGLPPDGMVMPPLDALLDPAFAWPDVLFPIVCTSTFSTAVPELSYLNRAVATIEGWFNFVTGGLAVETRLLPQTGRVAPPPRLAAS
jgi:hypothetical protein